MVLAAVLFIKRISETTQIAREDEFPEPESEKVSTRDLPEGIAVFRLFGAFTFGAADKLESSLKRVRQEPKVLILRMRQVLAMDATGLNALEDIHEKLARKGHHLILSGPHAQPLFTMEKAGFLDRIGRENVCPHVSAALARSREILGLLPLEDKDPLEVERSRLLEARNELTAALERANRALSSKNRNPEETNKI